MTTRRYCLIAAGLMFIAMMICGVFNLLVDPLGAYSGVHLQCFERWRASNAERPARAELVRRGQWEFLILGTSRPKIGLPIGHPVLATNQVCNLAVDSARMTEVTRILEYAVARNPVRRIIVFLDFSMFYDDDTYRKNFADSRFNPELSLFQYHAENLLGANAFQQSFEFTVECLRGKRPPAGASNGFQVRRLRPKTSQRDLFDKALKSHAPKYLAGKSSAEQMDSLRKLLAIARENKMEVAFAINPVHALDLELLFPTGKWEELEQWKRDVTHIISQENKSIPLWDFCGYWPPTCEAVPPPGDTTTRMRFYYEGSHYTPELGALILDTMFTSRKTQFGIFLSEGNIEGALESIRKARNEFAASRTDDLAWVARAAEMAKTSPEFSTGEKDEVNAAPAQRR